MTKYAVNRFRNVTIALNTPFDAKGEISLAATRNFVQYQYTKGVRSLYVCGSTGEGFLLSIPERKKILEAVVSAAPEDMTIIVHVGTAATREAVDLAAHAAETGAHATSAVPCVYYRPGEESIYRHWTAITEAADLPFFIYNIPQLTEYSLSMPMFRRMLQNERVAGIKCSSESVQDIMHFKEEGGKDFIVFNGPDEQYLAGRIMGADAGIGGTYAAMPELYLKLENLIREGRIDVALNLQRMITAFIARLCTFGSLYGTVKAIVRLDGCDIGDTRAPFLPVSSENPDVIRLHRDIKAAIRDTASW